MSLLGIDIGGTKAALRLECADGAVRESSFRWRPATGPDEDLAALARHLDALLEAASARRPAAVGIAMPAALDEAGRVVTWPGRPTWNGFALTEALGRLVPGAVVRVADDGDLAALAEARAARCPDLVYLGVGTGIGGGVVAGDRVFPGARRGSCEVGHIVVDLFGERCDCGRRGCVQSVASGPATLRRAARRAGHAVDFAALRAAFASGEAWSVRCVEESCAALAAAAISLSELIQPDLAVIGGGFAAGLDGFVPLVARQVERLSRPGTRALAVRAAALGGLSSLRGAMLLAGDAATSAAPAVASGVRT